MLTKETISKFDLDPNLPVPVAQSVERWTPCGESTRPGHKSPGFEARRVLDIYEPPGGNGCVWWQAAARRSREGDRPGAAMCVR